MTTTKEEFMYKVILAPHVSEKSNDLNGKYGQYVFRVLPQANKQMVKDTVQKLFDVKVTAVRIVNLKPEKVRNMRTGRSGVRSGYKKAYVSLAKGERIDFFVEGA